MEIQFLSFLIKILNLPKARNQNFSALSQIRFKLHKKLRITSIFLKALKRRWTVLILSETAVKSWMTNFSARKFERWIKVNILKYLNENSNKLIIYKTVTRDCIEKKTCFALVDLNHYSFCLDIFERRGIDLEMHYNNILWHSSDISYLPIDIVRAVKISRDEFVIDCKIKNYIPGGPAFIDCLPFMEDFVSNEFGVCQRIKLPEKQKEAAAKFPGAVYGMRMNLFMNTKDTSGLLTSSTGVRVTVFDPEYPKIPQVSEKFT